jgi:hypothetical protein
MQQSPTPATFPLQDPPCPKSMHLHSFIKILSESAANPLQIDGTYLGQICGAGHVLSYDKIKCKNVHF